MTARTRLAVRLVLSGLFGTLVGYAMARGSLAALAGAVVVLWVRVVFDYALQPVPQAGGRCVSEFGPDLGPAYRCVQPALHVGAHRDQYDNTWTTRVPS